MTTPPRTWHRMPNAEALHRLALAVDAVVTERAEFDALVVETDAGVYWTAREAVASR